MDKSRAEIAGGRPAFDLLGLGTVAVDDLLFVEQYPPPDSKVRIARQERHCGGMTATALVAASRLGARCAYAGVLGEDELSAFALSRMAAEGIDLSAARRQAGAGCIHSYVVVDERQRTRTIFYDMDGFVGASAGWPEPEWILSARVLFVDHLGVPGMVRAARLAREAGIPVVGDLESDRDPDFAELLDTVDHLIIPEAFARKLSDQTEAAAAAQWLSDETRVVVVTCGERGCWYIDPAGQLCHQPAYPVSVVDTTGCGDVFHGAYAAGLARGLSLEERVQLASAAAALKATQPGGQHGIPTWAAVEDFLARQ